MYLNFDLHATTESLYGYILVANICRAIKLIRLHLRFQLWLIYYGLTIKRINTDDIFAIETLILQRRFFRRLRYIKH